MPVIGGVYLVADEALSLDDGQPRNVHDTRRPFVVLSADIYNNDPEAHPLECQAFASTFASGKLDDGWSLAGLETALRWNRPGWHSWHAVNRLADLAPSRPPVATRLALKMLNDAPNDWDHMHWSEPIQSRLEATVDVRDDETQENRSAIVDHYVVRGDLEFRRYVAPRLA